MARTAVVPKAAPVGALSVQLRRTDGDPQCPLYVCAVQRRRVPVGASPTRRNAPTAIPVGMANVPNRPRRQGACGVGQGGRDRQAVDDHSRRWPASAIVATIQDAGAFISGREFAAFLGLTPAMGRSAAISIGERPSPF